MAWLLGASPLAPNRIIVIFEKYGYILSHIAIHYLFGADICTNWRPLKRAQNYLAPGGLAPRPEQVITLLEERPQFVINMVKIVHIFGALRAHIIMLCADWFVSTILHLSAFNRSLHCLFLKIGAHGVISALICTNLRPLKCTTSLGSQGPRHLTQTGLLHCWKMGRISWVIRLKLSKLLARHVRARFSGAVLFV